MRHKVLRETLCVHNSKQDAIAYATLIYNEHYLPLESSYPLDIEKKRREGIRMGQVILLRSKGVGGIFKIVKELWKRIRELGLQEVFIAIDPEDIPKYKQLNFVEVGYPIRYWDFADFAPVAIMVLDVEKSKGVSDERLLEHFF